MRKARSKKLTMMQICVSNKLMNTNARLNLLREDNCYFHIAKKINNSSLILQNDDNRCVFNNQKSIQQFIYRNRLQVRADCIGIR